MSNSDNSGKNDSGKNRPGGGEKAREARTHEAGARETGTPAPPSFDGLSFQYDDDRAYGLMRDMLKQPVVHRSSAFGARPDDDAGNGKPAKG